MHSQVDEQMTLEATGVFPGMSCPPFPVDGKQQVLECQDKRIVSAEINLARP